MGLLCTRRIRRAVLVVAALAVVSVGLGSPASAGTGLVSIGAGLKGRSGLSATVVADGRSTVSAPAFAADGGLWALTAAYKDDGTDALYVIESNGATPVRVLTGLHTPMGLFWYDGWLYVASGTTVDAYRGFDLET